MREHVKFEVAVEIISMMIAFAKSDNDEEKVKRLVEEKDRLYLGDESIIEKAYGEYSEEIKKRLEK